MLGSEGRFVTTRWSLVTNAQQRDAKALPADNVAADEALADLCQTYWPAVYAFLRRDGKGREEARDLAQGFFAKLLEKGWIERADQDRGSFRAFLVTLLRRFVVGEHHREHSLRRGGAVQLVSISADDSKAWIEPASHATPEQAFEAAWVQALLDRVLDELRQDYASRGQAGRFEALEPYLVAALEPAPFQALSASLGLAESSCRVAVFRARRRYRELLRGEIAATLGDHAGVDAELEALIFGEHDFPK